MKFQILFTIVLIASASAAAIDKSNVDLQKGIADFFAGLLTEVLLPPLQQTIQTSAELAAQLTASLAIGGLPALQALLGKRDVADQRFIDLLTQSFQQVFQQVIAPALQESLQSASLMAAQLLAGVADGGIPALNSILSGLLG